LRLAPLNLILLFQDMFQESLKKLRREQQEAEKLKALIQEKRESWKASGSLLKAIWDHRGDRGAEDQGAPVSPPW
jgi:hypothetical protein